MEMSEIEKSKKDWKQGLIFATIVLIIIIAFIWILPLLVNDAAIKRDLNLESQIKITIMGIIAIIGGWTFFNYQKRLDSRKSKEGKLSEVYKAANVVSGVSYRITAIYFGIGSIVPFVAGIYFIITEEKFWWIGLILIAGAIGSVILARNYWKLSKPKMKGRFY